ncbi:MAG: hypothetical protein AAGD92_15245 [Pseudomonadota bacterium]
MAHHRDKNRYALAVGHIAIEWNFLERDLQCLALNYLTLDAETAAHMFAFMGNMSRADFTAYLADRFEEDIALKEHIHYFVKLFQRLRANRNIVEHGVPALTRDGAFLGEIIKLDRRQGDLPFAASQKEIDGFLKDICAARRYVTAITEVVGGDQKGKIDHIDKPKMPERMRVIEQRYAEK